MHEHRNQSVVETPALTFTTSVNVAVLPLAGDPALNADASVEDLP
jgi:hypothetical protein